MNLRKSLLPSIASAIAVLGVTVAPRPLPAQGVAEVADDVSLADHLLALDDQRIEALTSADATQLADFLDDDLRYAHSSGLVDTKESFIELVESGKVKYLAYEPAERSVSFPARGIALVAGRARLVVENAQGRNDVQTSFLAVWREVGGEWKFLAWQSARLPPADR
jgi:hypothetical protein